MKTIWKYTLRPGLQFVRLPKKAEVLQVAEQNGHLRLWAAVETDHAKATEQRTFDVVGTGQEIPDRRRCTYEGTVVMRDTGLVWHVFELV